MRALEELPEHEKDLLLPTFFLRPWMAAKELDKAIERINKCFGDRRYIIDIDRYYVATAFDRPAVSDFIKLREPNRFEEWLAFVRNIPNAMPSLRLAGVGVEDIRQQIEIATNFDRAFLFRLDRETGVSVSDVVSAANEIEHANYLFAVDPGWSNNLLNHTLWASSVTNAVSAIRPEVPVIISGSSFPSSFYDVEPRAVKSIRERTLFNEVQRSNNSVNCLYGDWASVRPPSEENVPMSPVPRIDLALRQEWSFFRYRTNDGGYRKAAEDAMESAGWDDALQIWGTYLVRATADGDATEITYPGIATAARVNMHLHRQVNFDDPLGFIDTEDDFLD